MTNKIYPIHLDNESIDELATLYECGEFGADEWPDDELVDQVISLLNK